MATFECSVCSANYPVDEELAGRAIRCRQCGEWGRVSEPKLPKLPPPRPAALPPRRPPAILPPRRLDPDPWYYGYTEKIADIVSFLGVITGMFVTIGSLAAACFAKGGGQVVITLFS